MNEKRYVIAMDQGTTSSRCILFDRQGSVRSVVQRELPQIYPRPGWVEHDPRDIWSTQMGAAMEAMQRAGARPGEIAAIGIANQRETTVVWDAATGEPVCSAIVWQCRRTAERIEQLRRDGMEEAVRQKTGLIPDAYFSASKLEWILDHVPGAQERAERGGLRFGTVDSWLIWNLTGGRVHATDYTNASRTMLFDIHALRWDRELMDYFHIPASLLPQVLPSSGVFGTTDCFGGSIPIAAAAGDQQAALFGQCGFEPGDVKSTYGTGGFLLMNTGTEAVRSRRGLIATIAAGADGPVRYALEGSVFVAGAAIQWLRDELGMLESAARTDEICRRLEDAGGVYIVPAFVGLGAPYWEPYARGTVVGLTRGTGRAHLIRAVTESLAYQTNDLLTAMKEESGLPLTALKVDGGASANDFLMQFQADLSDIRIQRPRCIETTALGAAYLAGLATGFWMGLADVEDSWACERTFAPAISRERRQALQKGWARAVRCAVAWANDPG
ncbi:glycerol kinase GlpK [uncultured Oscillibacter sp.]|uniref:glycerol kinase GlpK n=1 Tax=uncultured Oscillibacter sp. TaxID=876091 RepID=UPI0025EB9651|nr:glycerol kinase GlpK [uncultured Oscillibacter sp.]